MLDITYDPQADAAYITLGRGRIAESEEVTPGFTLDYDREGRVVGIEVLSASKILAPGDWTAARLPGLHRSAQYRLPQLSPGERARLLAEAREHSRQLRDDPADQMLLHDLVEMQAENADALKP